MSDAYDYDYDTGSYAKNPVQVTRYRQNIQRFRDYGSVGQVSAPVSEGRFKEGIQPSNYQFSPPSAGVQADFANARDNRFRDPNTPPLDVSQISSIAYNRLFFNMDKDGEGTAAPATQRKGKVTRTSSPEGVVKTTKKLFGRNKTEVVPLTPQQTQAIRGIRGTVDGSIVLIVRLLVFYLFISCSATL